MERRARAQPVRLRGAHRRSEADASPWPQAATRRLSARSPTPSNDSAMTVGERRRTPGVAQERLTDRADERSCPGRGVLDPRSKPTVADRRARSLGLRAAPYRNKTLDCAQQRGRWGGGMHTYTSTVTHDIMMVDLVAFIRESGPTLRAASAMRGFESRGGFDGRFA